MTASTPTTDHEYYTVDSPYDVARWRPLVNWLLYVPHAIVLYGLRALACAVGFVYWVVLIATGRLDRNLYGMMALYERYSARATGYLLGFSERYPPFDFGAGGDDNSAYPPVGLRLPEPPATGSRKLAFNVVLALPHYVVLALFGLGAAAVAIVGWFAVLFTGRWPNAMRDFLVRYANYYYGVWAYAAMAESEYPKFGLRAA